MATDYLRVTKSRRLVFADRPRAGCAVPASLERRAAIEVAERLGGVVSARTPARKQAQYAGQLAAIVGQGVGQPRRPLRVRPRSDDAAALESAQPVGQDVRGDAWYQALKLAEPLRPFEEGLDDQQRPPVTDSLERRV